MLLTGGEDFAVLKNLDANMGYDWNTPLILSRNAFYGTASSGGSNSGGVVFGFTVLPQILNDGRPAVLLRSPILPEHGRILRYLL
jgi:hypothetical protein